MCFSKPKRGHATVLFKELDHIARFIEPNLITDFLNRVRRSDEVTLDLEDDEEVDKPLHAVPAYFFDHVIQVLVGNVERRSVMP